MNTKKEVPVLLLTGYLGSGKTTLLNKILANEKGIKFAVIVNDIGEVNIDAALIEKGGVVGQKDDSLVSLQNGCICCTLKMDLVEQLKEIVDMKRFDYIVIEASGICEPAPIAQTICSIPSLGPQYIENGILRLDSIVTVVDALRMKDEFSNGSDLMKKEIDEEDLASLVIQQIEFCNIILLNKAAEVEPKELEHLKQIIRAIQPKAEIFECNYGDVDLNLIVNTKKFDWETVSTSAGWIQEIESERNEEHEEEDDDDEHEHHHHHHDHDEEDEHEHHHHDDEDECCHHEHHHHDDDDEDECCHHEHHHHDDDDEDECCHHEHHHHDDEHEHHHDHGPDCTCGCHDHDHHHHHADEVFTSWGEETAKKFTTDEIKEKLHALEDGSYGMILRAKGMVPAEDGTWIYFDYVPGESDIRSGAAQVTGKLCVIGSKIDEDKLADLFLK